MDVKFLKFTENSGTTVKRNHTDIDDATRICIVKFYKRNAQKNKINFLNYVIKRFSFQINTIRTDNGHEDQTKFYLYLEGLRFCNMNNNHHTPILNLKVKRSHRLDDVEFYQLLWYMDRADLYWMLFKSEKFYNFACPNIPLKGQPPYKILREKSR